MSFNFYLITSFVKRFAFRLISQSMCESNIESNLTIVKRKIDKAIEKRSKVSRFWPLFI